MVTVENRIGRLIEVRQTGKVTIEELQDATRSLQALIDQVRSSPRDFIARPASKELEVQP